MAETEEGPVSIEVIMRSLIWIIVLIIALAGLYIMLKKFGVM